MAARANWKGYLKLSLVSCPVQLFPATTTKERVSFHLLNRDTGNRLRRKLVDPETDEPVENDAQVKGYEIGKNEYVLVEEEEIEKVAVESSHTIDIEHFVPRSEIDQAYLDTPYFLTPDGKMGDEAFAVIREAMRDKDVVGIGRVVLYRRERPIMLEPRGNGLVATTLRYAYEVRDDADYFDGIADVAVSEEMLDLATHIIGRKMGHFEPKRFEDAYQTALLEIIAAKRDHRPVREAAAAPKTGNVVSLMDALRRSIANEPGAAAAPAGSGDGGPKSTGRRESAPSPAEAASAAKSTKPGRKAAPAKAAAKPVKAAAKAQASAATVTAKPEKSRRRKAA